MLFCVFYNNTAKPIKERIHEGMKKLICLLLALVMCAALFTGCGKFDMDNADISEYVELCDISDIPYENLVKAYEDYRVFLSEDMTSCALPRVIPLIFL